MRDDRKTGGMRMEEKRMVDTYEIESSFYINGKEIVFGANEKADFKYMIGFCSISPLFGFEEYHSCVGTNNYAEAMREYAERIRKEAELSLTEQRKRGIYVTYTPDECIPGSESENYEGQLIVIRADILQRDKRTVDYQLCRATGGNGCNPNSRGQSIYAVNIYDGREMRYDRTDVLGIIKPEYVPVWAKERIRQIEQKKHRHEPER